MFLSFLHSSMKYCPPFRIHRWCYGSLQKSSISLKSFRFFFKFQENVLMDQKSSNLFVRMINKSSGRLTFTSAFVCMVLIRILFFSQKQMLTKTNPSRSVEIPFRSMTTRRKKDQQFLSPISIRFSLVYVMKFC